MSLLNSALQLAEAGIHVFPLVPRGKNPLTKNGVKDATTDEDTIRKWWRSYPNANIGIAMGKVSGILGIDIDYKDGCRADFLKSLPPTVVTLTPSGGHHAFFKYDERIKNGLKLEKGATIRSDGYYFVAPPSIHPNGGTYTAMGNGLKKYLHDGEKAEVPEWIFELQNKERKEHFKLPETVRKGEQHTTLFRQACSLRGQGFTYDEILAALVVSNDGRLEDPAPQENLKKIAKDVCERYEQKVAVDVSDGGDSQKKKKEPSPFAFAQKFLNDCGFFDENGNHLLRYYQQDFYRYKEGYYQKLDDEWIEDRLNRWLVDTGYEHIAGVTKKTNSILKMLKTKPIYIPGQINVPCVFKNGEWENANYLIPMKNGLFDIKHFIKTGEYLLHKHNPNYFCRHKLSFDFIKEATCPVYDNICKDIFRDEAEINLWNEVVGIHIYSPFLIEKFFILEGEGANGKSVLRTILTCLLGKENVSSVPIECFNPSSFAFINTLGKLANIIPDMKDVSDIDEGALKAFVSREDMSFNRKNKPFIDAKPTSYLTICTNVLPRFNDKSDGIWRRIVLFKLEKSVPEEKQNPAFRESSFWADSNELSGIFNKAIGMIKGVIENNGLNIPEQNFIELNKYKKDLNIIYHFAEAHLEFSENGRASVRDVYESYKKFSHDYGGKAFGKISFDKQLKNLFKKQGHEIDVEKQRPATGFGEEIAPSWHWKGLSLFKGEVS